MMGFKGVGRKMMFFFMLIWNFVKVVSEVEELGNIMNLFFKYYIGGINDVKYDLFVFKKGEVYLWDEFYNWVKVWYKVEIDCVFLLEDYKRVLY